MLTWKSLAREFSSALRVEPYADQQLMRCANDFLAGMQGTKPISKPQRLRNLLGLVNSKFDINDRALAQLYATLAEQRTTFNYHEKQLLAHAFDHREIVTFNQVLRGKGLDASQYSNFFRPALEEETVARLHSELRNPTLVRKDSKPRDWSKEICFLAELSGLRGRFAV